MSKIGITADCTCDLPEELCNALGVKLLHFYVTTETGCFKDMAEITAGNIIEYFENGGRSIVTAAPTYDEYVEFFGEALKSNDELIHVTIGSSMSRSYDRAMRAAKVYKGKVKVFDSQNLTTGIAHTVVEAAEMSQMGISSEKIIERLETIRGKVMASFIVNNVDFLYITGRVKRALKVMCDTFSIHPVLCAKNGEIKLKRVYFGDYDKCIIRYVKKELADPVCINKKKLFLTHSDCSVKVLNQAKELISSLCSFKSIDVAMTSATITSNCGAKALGLMYMVE